jgi:hypothetical protein
MSEGTQLSGDPGAGMARERTGTPAHPAGAGSHDARLDTNERVRALRIAGSR